MSTHIHKSHNVSVLLYHFVCPARYRRVVFSEEIDHTLKELCPEISKRYEIHFVKIGTDEDHVHFLVQSVPKYSPTRIITIIKSITAKEIFKRHPEVKEALWGGEFWSDGYFVSSIGKHGNEDTIREYVKKQGMPDNQYKKLLKQQLTLF